MAMPLLSPYISTKFAVEGLSESIAYELEPFGIKVVLIEPGAIKTSFDTGMVMTQNPKSPYYENMQKFQTAMISVMKNGSLPGKVAQVILDAVNSPNPAMRYTAGDDAALIAQKRKELPDAEFKKLIFDFFK